MEADPCVGLRQVAAQPVEPGGVPLVQAAHARTSPATHRRPRGAGRAGSAATAVRRVARTSRSRATRRSQACSQLGAGDAGGERVHRSGLERVAHHRAEGERGPLSGVEPVEACGEQRVERGRERVRGRDAARARRPPAARGTAGCRRPPRRSVACRPAPGERRRSPRRATSLAAAESGPSSSTLSAPIRSTQSGWRSNRSGRATQTMRTGASRSRAATSRSRSRSAGSARCASSMTTISGCMRASASISRRNAQPVSSRGPALLEPQRRRHLARAPTARCRAWPQLVDGAVALRLLDDLAQRPVGRCPRRRPGSGRSAPGRRHLRSP